jgi:uncharacterized membrane protein YccF (DUF307 family)
MTNLTVLNVTWTVNLEIILVYMFILELLLSVIHIISLPNKMGTQRVGPQWVGQMQ